MELKDTEREYADWADEEDLLLQQADAANAPFRTWLVPDVCDMDQCVKSWFLPQILQEMNTRLAKGDLSALLRQPVVSEQVRAKDLRLGGITYWRLNRVDFLADVDLETDLVVESEGRDVPGTFAFVLTLWFCTEEGFRFEVQGLCPAAERPERSFWKLDRFLVPILRRDEIEAGAERIWENCLPGKKPEERNARMLADAMKLQVTELCLFGQNRTRAILFFQDGVVQVQDEIRPEDDGPPAPVPVQVAAGTIVLNTAARRERGDPAILHECIHYEWHLLFYRLQKAVSSSPLAFRMKKVQSSLARRPADPLRWMEQQADLGAVALLLPLGVMRSRAWRLYQEASAFPARNGYFNHPGFRWERVIRTVSDEYDVSRTMVRRRLVMLGHPAAKGAVNFVDGRYITPFAFTEEYSGDGTDTLVISRKDMAGLYHRSRPFRELLETGSFLWADGHVCLNDPQYLRRTEKGLALTPWANAHADACCLRFGLLKMIKKGAFMDCTHLTRITLPQSLYAIDDETFRNCISLERITLPKALYRIGKQAFTNCQELYALQLTDNIHLIEAEAFMGCKKLYEIVLPPLLRAVSSGTFASCSNLTKLTLNDQLKMIGDGAFYQCRQLRDVYMPDSVTTIGEDAFMECGHLQRVRFSPNIERIGANAFRDCSSLPQPLLPNETLIGKNAFKGCKKQ